MGKPPATLVKTKGSSIMGTVPDWRLDNDERAEMDKLHRELERVLFHRDFSAVRLAILNISEFSGHPTVRATMMRLCRSTDESTRIAAKGVMSRLHNLESYSSCCAKCEYFCWPEHRCPGRFRDYLGKCSLTGSRKRAGTEACPDSGLLLPQRRKTNRRKGKRRAS